MSEMIPEDIRAVALAIVQKPYWPLQHEHEVEALADAIASAILAERRRFEIDPASIDMQVQTDAYNAYREAKALEDRAPSLEHGLAAGRAWRRFLDTFLPSDCRMGDAPPYGAFA